MPAHARQAVLVAFGAATAIACSLAFRLLAPRLPDGAEAWAPLAVAGLAGAAAAALASALVRRRYERLLGRVGSLVRSLRKTPSAGLLTQARRDQAGGELATFLPDLEELAAAYRTALADVVEARENLERLRASHVRGVGPEAGRPPPNVPTHFVVGSSRHRMVARLAPNFNVIAATQPLRQFLGRSSHQLLARSFLDLVSRDDVPALQQALREALRDGECHNVTVRVLPAEREGDPEARRERFLQMDVMTCYDEGGTPTNFRCHFLDVTNQVLAEQELSRANEELRRTNEALERLKESYFDLYHFAPVLYFSLDPAGNFVAFNESMLRILGYPREALLGQSYATLLPESLKAGFFADPGVLQRPGEVETRWVKQDGSVIDVWIGTTTIRDASGGFLRSRSAARDVSETRRLANALRSKAEELGQANLQLRRINQELEEFSYVVSHDLKEPLRTIEAFSTFLASDYGDVLHGDGQDYLNHLRQASRRLGLLIDDLLTLSRTGKVIHTPRAFTWRPVLETVLGDLRDLIQRKGALVRVQQRLPHAMGDPERVMQLLANLISNALKYSRPGVTPEVTLGSFDDPEELHKGFVTLFVRDNGIGIAPAHHEQIFRIFRRLHHRDEVEGTGAGLAICKRIVEAHGGRIRVESAPEEGSTFFFTLPAAPLIPAGRGGRPAGEPSERPDDQRALAAARR
jgi:PAS domain S-box-containing protein